MNKVQITLEQAMKIEGINRYVVDGLPLKTYDCSQITDGYASLILATEQGLRKLGVPEIGVRRGRGLRPGHRSAAEGRPQHAGSAGAYRAMRKAYEMAGALPADVNVAEIHDCFTVAAAIGTEVLGKASPGKGARYWVEGKANVDGDCAINMSGGLIAKGHPVGATGVAMLGSCFRQLKGKHRGRFRGKIPRWLRPSILAARCALQCAPCCETRHDENALVAMRERMSLTLQPLPAGSRL